MPGITEHRQELANVLTHGLGIILAIGGGAALIALAVIHAGSREIISVSVFVASLIFLYTISTLYHAARNQRLRSRLKILDHCAIFLLIAGTYTPFTVAALRGGWGWSLFGIIWGLALLGIVFKLFFTGRFQRLSTATYIGMGWLVIIAFFPLMQVVPPWALVWLIVGGIFYTTGTVFYHVNRLPYAHAIWHVFVLIGSICHFTAVTVQVLSPRL